MKIIELLNKIANGNIPKKIIYNEYVYQWNNIIKNYEREADINTTLNWDYIAIECLNEPVEILEEEKKIPEELPTWFSLEKDCENDNIQYANYNFERMYGKINEICDYLKSKGE